jgi:integrase
MTWEGPAPRNSSSRMRVLLLRAGTPVKVVSEGLGHSSPNITLSVYAHVMPGIQREVADTFAALVSGG